MSICMNSPLFYPCPLCLEFVVCGLSVVVIWPGPVCLSVPNKGLCSVFTDTEQNINQWYGKEMRNIFQQKSLTEFYREEVFWLTLNSTQNHTDLSNQEHTAFSAYGIVFKLVLTHWLLSVILTYIYTYTCIHTHTLLGVRSMEVHNLGLKLCTSLGCKSWLLCGKGKTWWRWLHCSHKSRSEWNGLST